MFPEDFQQGSMTNTILKNFRIYAVFSLLSGEPLLNLGGSQWTRSDNPGLTNDAQGRTIGGINYFRGRWNSTLDLRFTKRFSLGRSRNISVYSEIFNALNNKIDAQYPSGYNLNDKNINTVTNGVDVKWEDAVASGSNPHENPLLVRFNADFNGDGVLTVQEASLGEIASRVMLSTMDKRRWGLARRVRLGVDVSF